MILFIIIYFIFLIQMDQLAGNIQIFYQENLSKITMDLLVFIMLFIKIPMLLLA